MITAPKWRIKEWDYYLILSDDFAGAFTISDDVYIGLQSVSLLIFGEKPWEHTDRNRSVLSRFFHGNYVKLVLFFWVNAIIQLAQIKNGGYV